MTNPKSRAEEYAARHPGRTCLILTAIAAVIGLLVHGPIGVPFYAVGMLVTALIVWRVGGFAGPAPGSNADRTRD